MTSLIFGAVYMGHKGIVNHRREKQRQKNYQRWEGLRDEYDEQRKISRESRSLDIQRTGATDFSGDVDNDRPILTLRDQQEANDARTSWRPQESFDGPRTPAIADNRRASVEVTAGSGLRPVPVTSHKTGSTWDEDLPQPLRVSRRNWDEYQPSNLSGNVSRSGSVRSTSGLNTPQDSGVASKRPSPRPEVAAPTSAPLPQSIVQPASIEPVQYETPGGRMAELIELGNSPPPVPFSSAPQPYFTGSQTGPYSTQPPIAPANSGMQEWWNRP
jgi:hypothetical protein